MGYFFFAHPVHVQKEFILCQHTSIHKTATYWLTTSDINLDTKPIKFTNSFAAEKISFNEHICHYYKILIIFWPSCLLLMMSMLMKEESDTAYMFDENKNLNSSLTNWDPVRCGKVKNLCYIVSTADVASDRLWKHNNELSSLLHDTTHTYSTQCKCLWRNLKP